MKKLVFKTNIVREKSNTHFAMLSLWDNVTDFNYIFRFETDKHVWRMELHLDAYGVTVAALSPYNNAKDIDTTFYRMLWNEFKPEISINDPKTLADAFKVFTGVVWASPVKLTEK